MRTVEIVEIFKQSKEQFQNLEGWKNLTVHFTLYCTLLIIVQTKLNMV